MKMIAGAFAFACSNSFRTREAPTPTNTSMNSDPLAEKNGTPASPATARASSVFPVPGGPTSSAPFGTRAPSGENFAGLAQKLHDLLELFLRFVDAGHRVEAGLRS